MRKAIISVLLICLVFVSGCASKEPVLPPEAVSEIKENLGYALVPTYLPEGFQYIPDGLIVSGFMATMTFIKSPIDQDIIQVSMIYPTVAYGFSLPDETMPEIPEDAVTEIDINGSTAYKIRGGWLGVTWEETTVQEWDYDSATYIRFSMETPDGSDVWVFLGDLRGKMTDDDELVKIAESVVVIE